MKRTLFFSLLIATFALLMPSCNSSSEDDSTTVDYQYDIVTLKAVNASGTSFTAQKDASATSVTLTTTQSMDTTYVKVGERVLIVYQLPTGVEAYTNSSITLIGYQPIINDTIETGSNDSANTEQRVVSAWVTGKYLNIYSVASCYSEPKEFRLVVDEKTVDEDYPTVYLIFKPDNDMGVISQNIYASFDISTLQSSGAQGFYLQWRPSGGGSGMEKFTFLTSAIKPNENFTN